MTSLMNEEQRKIFRSIAGQEVPTFQMTCTEAILPRGDGRARGRQIEYGETSAMFDVYELHNCNCILPYEKFEASFDQERGQFYPLGSRGLFRKVKATESGSICTNVSCLIETEGQGYSTVEGEEACRAKLYETEISVWATRPIIEDSIFWVTYQPDRDKPLVVEGEEGVVKAAFGRWVPIDKPSDREFLEFTCGRPYGNFTSAKAQMTSNPGTNNIFPLADIIIDNDNPEFYGGNFSNLAFGEVASEESNGKGNFGNTTDVGGEVWKLFKFDTLRSASSGQHGLNNNYPNAIQSNEVYGIQCLKRGLYICHVEFNVFMSAVCLDGDWTNSSSWPKIATLDGSDEINGSRKLFEMKDNFFSSSFRLFKTDGEFLRTLTFITHKDTRSDVLLDSDVTDAGTHLLYPQDAVNFDFHFYIADEEVGTVMVNQLNSIVYGISSPDQDHPAFQHVFNPYIQNTNNYKAMSMMEFVDVELVDLGEIVPVRNPISGTDGGDGGGGDDPGGEGGGGGGPGGGTP